MGKNRKVTEACMKKYSFPLFCASWADVPQKSKEGENEEDKGRRGYLILGGGGGDGRTGVKNALVAARYDFDTCSLSEAVHTFYTDDDPPYRMAVHPVRDGIICSFSNGCRWFELDGQDESEAEVVIKPENKTLTELEDVGQQRSLVFSTDGTLLAAGGEDGHLRVFEWPSLKIVLDQPAAHKSIKDLDFSLDGTFLASLGDSGPCRVWNLSTSSAVASLSVDKGESLGFCRFSRDGLKPLLFMTVKQGEKGLISHWDTNAWKKVGTQVFEKNPISAFSISSDGKLLAIGTSEGDVSVIEVSKMRLYQRVKGAHIIFVTSMEFSRDSRALVSVSGDSSARVTRIERQKHTAATLQILFLIMFLAILAFHLMKSAGL
eukprot:Gb_05819 [translate_table: standard]